MFWVSYPRNHCQIQHREVLLCVLSLTCRSLRASLVSKRVKRLPAMWEIWVQSLGQEWGRPGFSPWVRKIPCRRKWQPTPVILPGKSHGRRSLVGYSSWGRKESDTTERLHFHFHFLVGLWFILVNFCGRNDFCLSPFSIMLAVSFFFNTIIIIIYYVEIISFYF